MKISKRKILRLYLLGLTIAVFASQMLIVSALGASEPPSVEWNKTFGGDQDDSAWSVLQTSDGGYILAGVTSSFGAGYEDFWLVKTDSTGNMQWSKTYGGPNTDDARCVQQTADGGYIIAGFTRSFGAGGNDAWLIKTDASGNHEWNRTYGGTDHDAARWVLETSDEGYIFVGWTGTWPDVWLVKTDSSGNMEWQKTYGGTESDYGRSVQQTNDGGYIVVGETWSFGVGYTDAWLIKTDSNGNMQWNKTYNVALEDTPYSVRQTIDRGYIFAGSTYSPDPGYADFWLVKTDSNGNMQWNKTYGGVDNDWGTAIDQTTDGGYILAGYTRSFGAGGWDIWLVKTDPGGNMEWNQTLGGPENDILRSVQQTTDAGFIAAGSTRSFGVREDALLIKLGWGLPPPTPVAGAKLNRVWPEHHRFDMSKELEKDLNTIQDLYAKVFSLDNTNYLNILVKFEVFKTDMTSAGPDIQVHDTLAPSEEKVVIGPLNPVDYGYIGTKLDLEVKATCWYYDPVLGDYVQLEDASTKWFSFIIVP